MFKCPNGFKEEAGELIKTYGGGRTKRVRLERKTKNTKTNDNAQG